jgi:lysophospholipase L1-like esterase
MKTILCFGDSNTWGFDPVTKDRLALSERWPSVMACELGAGFLVIPEGLNGRTTVWEDPVMPFRRGSDHLLPCLHSHKPLDAVVIMLGTNDMKVRFSASAYDVGRGMALLADIVRKSECGRAGAAPHTLLVAPPPFTTLAEFAEQFEGAPEKSRRLPSHYRAVAQEFGCRFFDSGDVVKSSEIDGIHLDAVSHALLGRAIAACLREMLS